MTLPAPDAASLTRSQALSAHIRQTIASTGGWIPFSRYMALALYTPGLGYYAAGEQIFGADGDFTTAPEMTPLFGRTLAHALAPTLRETGGDVLELGAGTGRLAAHLLSEFERLGCPPRRYFILEVSAGLAARQRATLAKACPAWQDRIVWLTTLPDTFCGVIVANEVLDALPVEGVVGATPSPLQRGVVLVDGELAWQDRPFTDPTLAHTASELDLAAGYQSEFCPAAPALVSSLGETLSRGGLLLIDYGHLRASYYHPQRHMGTLRAQYRHHSVDDVFYLPGLCDLTAHVDFSAVLDAATTVGLQTGYFGSLARYLLDAGILSRLAECDPANPAVYLPQANAVQRLLSPAEMGESFKVAWLLRGG